MCNELQLIPIVFLLGQLVSIGYLSMITLVFIFSYLCDFIIQQRHGVRALIRFYGKVVQMLPKCRTSGDRGDKVRRREPRRSLQRAPRLAKQNPSGNDLRDESPSII